MRRINWACVVTVSNLLLGFCAVLLCLKGQVTWALCALTGAFLGDGIDGTIARKTNMTSEFGERLDSLSDLVGFGVAPAMFALQARPSWDPALVVASCMYLACGAIRLARYDPLEQKSRFRGMPIPITGLLLTAFSCTLPAVGWFAAVPACLALLMVSDIPFFKVKPGGRESLWSLALALLSLAALVATRDLSAAFLAFSVPYLVLNLGLALVRGPSGASGEAASEALPIS